ncbi:tyrosine-type recombinase/integrase [Anaerohalosphaera lusitana]|nr:tyrosine-type recombinase/integrase [Anaerohalosphaera lusitana]
MINHIILHSTDSTPEDSRTPQSLRPNAISKQAENDQELVKLWLYGKSKHTQRYYRKDVERFFEYTNKSLREIILKDLQEFANHIDEQDLVDGSKRRILSSVKSFFAFAHKLGYLTFDVARVLALPTPKDTLAERILTQEQVRKIINAENHPRNKLILKTLFITGIRVSELCSLCWKDLKERSEGGQVTVYGKGKKTRTLLIPEPLWSELMNFRGSAFEDVFVFRGRNRSTQMHSTTVLRIVKKAAQKAGLKVTPSPHWLRHAHSSIACEKAPLHVVQNSLGHSSIQTTSHYLHVKPDDCSSKYLDL